MAKYLSSIIISIILITASLFIIVYVLLSGSFFNEKYNIKCLEGTNYVEQCSTNIKSSLTNLSASTGIKEEIMMQSVSLEDLRIEIKKYYSAMCKYLQIGTGKFEYTVDTKRFEDRMYNLIMANLSADNRIVDNNGEAGIKNLVKESGKVYANMISTNTDLVKVFNKFFSVYTRYKIHALIIFVGALLLLIIINRKRFAFLRYLGVSFILVGLVTLGAYAVASYIGISHKLNLEPAYLKQIMEAILSGFLRASLICGACVTGVGLILTMINKLLVKMPHKVKITL